MARFWSALLLASLMLASPTARAGTLDPAMTPSTDPAITPSTDPAITPSTDPSPSLAPTATTVFNPSQSSRVVHARVDRSSQVFDVNRDLTYTRTDSQDTTLFTDRALRRLDRSVLTFYPEKQSVEVVEAWVDQPDGSRVPVQAGGIFTRPSAASQSAPGFVNSQTTTVLFPRLIPGSRTHIVWRFVQKTPPLLGLNTYNVNTYEWDTGHDETRVNIPADVPYAWRARGGFQVEDTTYAGIRHIVAHIDNTGGREDEPAMVDHMDFMPLFLGTTLANLEATGAIIHQASEGRAAVTPEIAALAAHIAGDRVGLDAVRAIHAWVAENIRYIAVYLNPDDGWVPHLASEVLKSGYGDCKDYVVLMRALLAARGIESEMAAINWGNRYDDLPLWVPYFNHAILYLPAYDHYLNPTDRAARFDALDRRLSGKQVVIMTKDGRVARTPPATLEANHYRYNAQISIGADGTIDGTATFTMSPNNEIMVRGWLSTASSTTDMARRILGGTPEGGFGDYTASDPRDILNPLTLSGHWHSPHAVNPQENWMFLRVPGGIDIYSPLWDRVKLSPDSKRKSPLLADIADTTRETAITLPPGMEIARMPEDVDVTTSVGRFTARYRATKGTVTATRSLVISQQVVPPEQYADMERLIYAPVVDARATILLTPVVR